MIVFVMTATFDIFPSLLPSGTQVGFFPSSKRQAERFSTFFACKRPNRCRGCTFPAQKARAVVWLAFFCREKAKPAKGLPMHAPNGHDAASPSVGRMGLRAEAYKVAVVVMSKRNIIVYRLLLGFFFCCVCLVLVVGFQAVLAPMVTASSFA